MNLNSDAPLALDLSIDSSSVLVAFGGIYGAMGMPPFEFFNLTRNLPVNKVYLRDPHQGWYHFGLPGIAENIIELAGFLEKKFSEHGITNPVMVGNSMGGFAALLFGALLKVPTIHSFSPQTFINRFSRWRHKDERWQEQVETVLRSKQKKYLDLRKVLKKEKNDNCQYTIYYSPHDRLDEIHASRMAGIKNVVLKPCGEGGHGVIKILRDNGTLKKLILESFDR